ncbi:YccF domain-containing protein [Caulobacter sp. LjRoot300]|uniref:YccF domain-containing protein n=1 Tax=Caulobacter sp. LjRoot300 TaxID=3342321 RepID=UPI003ECFBAA2
MIRLLLNILWFIFGGFISGCLWLLGGALLAITIVGLPYAGAAWRIAGFAFWPFGKEIVPRDLVTGREDLGTGPLGCVLNVIWFVLGGWYIALAHLIAAVVEAVTIIGIPFAIKDLQLAVVALAPIGRTVVDRR